MEGKRQLKLTEAALISTALAVSAGLYYQKATQNHIHEACASKDARAVASATLERVRFHDVSSTIVELSESCDAPLLRNARQYVDDGANDNLYLTAVALNEAASATEGRRLAADATQRPQSGEELVARGSQ
jgi:hypothetical protein